MWRPNALRELWKLNWDFFFRKSKFTVKCWKCKEPVKLIARPPRLDDYGPVSSTKCKCGAINEASRYTHTLIGFGRPMPERSKRDNASKIQ